MAPKTNVPAAAPEHAQKDCCCVSSSQGQGAIAAKSSPEDPPLEVNVDREKTNVGQPGGCCCAH